MEQSRISISDAAPIEQAAGIPGGSAVAVTDTVQQDDEPNYLHPWELVPVFSAISLANFILGLDNTIIGTATPTITNEFHSLTDFGWYGSAYRLATCSSQFVFSKIYEQWPVKWVLIISVSVLKIGSILYTTAANSPALIVGRAIAGSGSAGILIGVYVAITHSVPPRWRPVCNSTIGGLECIAMIVAPVTGGALTTYVSWRWCFRINVPAGGLIIVVLAILLKPGTQKLHEVPLLSKLKQLNLFALLIFSGSVVFLLLALEWGGSVYPWSSRIIIALLVVAVVSFGIFLAFEILRKDRATIPKSILFNRTAGLSILYAFTSSTAYNVVDYFGASAVESGLMLLPSIISLSVAAISSGFIVSCVIKYYNPLMLLGSTMMAIGYRFLTIFKPDTGSASWIGWQVLFGIGLGFAFPVPWTVVQTALLVEDIPSGLSIVFFAVSIGAALIISISQNVFTYLFRDGLSGIPNVDANAIIKHGATNLLHIVPLPQRDAVLNAYS
ncbi:MFS toxin efflux pump [Xylariaceae sp. FL0255]|nr:MFS toxin efflux pump [Xylariaceae sp. FL0255]